MDGWETTERPKFSRWTEGASIIEWVEKEESLKAKVSANPKLSKAKQIHSGGKASTADVEQALVDYTNEQRKQHRGCGHQKKVMNKLLELKPDALGGLPANAKPEEALAFKVKFNSWYQRFRKRRGFSIRRRISVGQKLPKGHEGMGCHYRSDVGQLVETGARCCDCSGFVAERGGVWFGATNEERRRDEPFISRYPTDIL